jgi:hypothetical protein
MCLDMGADGGIFSPWDSWRFVMHFRLSKKLPSDSKSHYYFEILFPQDYFVHCKKREQVIECSQMNKDLSVGIL